VGQAQMTRVARTRRRRRAEHQAGRRLLHRDRWRQRARRLRPPRPPNEW